MRLLTLAALLLVAPPSPAAAWGGLRGDGRKVTTHREVPPFTAVTLAAPIELRVRVGGPQAVAVTIDGNLQEHLATRVEDGTLVVDAGRRIRWDGPARVEITVPSLARLEVAGAGDALVEGSAGGDVALVVAGAGDLVWKGTAGRVSARVVGAGDLELHGRAERLEVEVAGSGDVDGRGLVAGDADVSVSGSGDVQVRLAGGALSARVAGSGTVRWSGEGRVERASVSGAGEIVRAE